MKLINILLKIHYQSRKALFCSFLLLIILFPIHNYGQDFETSPFISMPGNNTDIDVLNVIGDFNPSGYLSYICWLNNADNNYTIYLKRTSPNLSDNILIFSDTCKITNPKIALSREKIRIVWQMGLNNHWQILSRELIGDSLTNIISITDSLTDNITPTVSTSFIAWINNGNLYYQYCDSLTTKPKLLDSINCSNPELNKFDSSQNFEIVYEKGAELEKQIFLTKYLFATKPYRTYEKITNGSNNIKPHFNLGNVGVHYITYQVYINGKWKAVNYFSQGDTTKNISYNCQNPACYFYSYLTTKRISAYTPSFIVYDTDSLESNKEIFLETKLHYVYTPDTLFNISNSEGDDYSPHIFFYCSSDTLYIAIIWIHEEGGGKNIWISKSAYNPLVDAVDEHSPNIRYFALYQNYPNPFNPITNIKFNLSKRSFVYLKVFDSMGREIATLVSGELIAGKHTIIWNASEMSSGVYFYRLQVGMQSETKKLILIK